MISKFIDKHPVIFWTVVLLFLIMLLNALEESGRACKKEWGSKWEGNEKITVFPLFSNGFQNLPATPCNTRATHARDFP